MCVGLVEAIQGKVRVGGGTYCLLTVFCPSQDTCTFHGCMLETHLTLWVGTRTLTPYCNTLL